MIDLSLKTFSLFTLIYLVQNNKVLLIKRHPSKNLLGSKIIGLGGKIEPNEDILTSAKREFLEETGLNLLDPIFKGTYTWIDNDFIGISYLIVATRYKGKLLQKSEEGELAWYDIDNLNTLDDFADYQNDFILEILKNKNYFYSSLSLWNGDKLISYLDSKEYFLNREKQKYNA